MKNFFIQFTERTNFPLQAKEFILQKFDQLNASELSNFDTAKNIYFEKGNDKQVLDILLRVSENANIRIYTIHLLFLIYCAFDLRQKYLSSGYSEELFWDLMQDVKYKLDECMEVKGIVGTFVFEWFDRHFNLTRFSLGRFQYEVVDFDQDDFTLNGITIKKSDKVINFHIPYSKKPIDRKTRLLSYKMAYDFFKAYRLDDGNLVFTCYSWLLYPANKQVFPEKSNSRDFMDDFTIVKVNHLEGFHDAWRIFGVEYNGNPDDLPIKSSMHKNFVEYLKNGNSVGNAVGVFLFDGEKIL